MEQNQQVTTTAGLMKAKAKALKWSIQIRMEPYENHTHKNRALQNAEKNNKTLRRRVLIEEGLAKSSKKQHLENTDKWHFCKAGSFHTVNHRGPLPLKELHSTGETIVWRDPGGSWACLPPAYKCNHPATVSDTCGIRPKQHTKKREKRPKSQEQLGPG